MTVDIQFKFPDWAAKIQSQEERINYFLAAQIQTNRGMMFDREGAHNGRPRWAPLKFRSGQILTHRGTLRKSIAPRNAGNGQAGPDGIVRFAGDTITVGTKLLYARLMNDGTTKMPGGVLRPTKAKALKIPLPAGKSATDVAKQLGKKARRGRIQVAEGVYREQKFIFRKWVKIPARPFDDWNLEDQTELDTSLLNLMTEILNNGTN